MTTRCQVCGKLMEGARYHLPGLPGEHSGRGNGEAQKDRTGGCQREEESTLTEGEKGAREERLRCLRGEEKKPHHFKSMAEYLEYLKKKE